MKSVSNSARIPQKLSGLHCDKGSFGGHLEPDLGQGQDPWMDEVLSVGVVDALRTGDHLVSLPPVVPGRVRRHNETR